MAEPLVRVELTASFLERLDAIEAFLVEADAGFAFDDLLAELRATVIPNLQRFPRIGRRYLVHPPQSAEALAQLAALPAGEAAEQFDAMAAIGASAMAARPGLTSGPTSGRSSPVDPAFPPRAPSRSAGR